jgi:DNA polymerase-3 subunit delta'
MAARLEQPLYEPPSGLASHGVAAVRLLLRKLVLRPALARRKVFLIGDAERLVPQTGAETAANALLKALEEPPADTVFVLTTAAAASLLPTVLSRVVRVRVAPLADSIVAAFGQRELGMTGQRDLAQRVALAGGRIGRLLADGERGASGADAAERFLAAVEAGPVRRYGFALGLQPFQARGGFTDMLDGLLERLRERARSGGQMGKTTEAIARVMEVRGLAQGNVNPQLLAAVLADALAGGVGAAGEAEVGGNPV